MKTSERLKALWRKSLRDTSWGEMERLNTSDLPALLSLVAAQHEALVEMKRVCSVEPAFSMAEIAIAAHEKWEAGE